MYDMSQLSQIPLLNPDFINNSYSSTSSNDGNVARGGADKITAPTLTNNNTSTSCYITARTTTNSSADKSNKNATKEQSKINHSFTQRIITLPQPTNFGMKVTPFQKSNDSSLLLYVSDVIKGGQADSQGFKIDDRVYHVPPGLLCDDNSNINSNINSNSNSIMKEPIPQNDLKPISIKEIVQWSQQSTLRPISILVERSKSSSVIQQQQYQHQTNHVSAAEHPSSSSCTTTTTTGNDSAATCTLTVTKAQLKNALCGKGFPLIPCCRKCNHPSRHLSNRKNVIKNHHFLCHIHGDFHDSGAKDKLIIIMSGALVGCEACIHEFQHGKKGGKLMLRHNEVCIEISGKGGAASVSNGTAAAGGAAAGAGRGSKGKQQDAAGAKGIKAKEMGTRKVMMEKNSKAQLKSSAITVMGGAKQSKKELLGKSPVVTVAKKTILKRKSVAAGDKGSVKKANISKQSGGDGGGGNDDGDICENSKAKLKASAITVVGGAKQSKKELLGKSPVVTIAKKTILKRKSVAAGDKGSVKKAKISKQSGGDGGGNDGGGNDGGDICEEKERSQVALNQTREEQKVDRLSRTPVGSVLQGKLWNSQKKTQGSIQVTPAGRKEVTNESRHVEQSYSPMVLTDDQSVSKWVPCPNPWGDRAHSDGDFVLFSPEDYTCAFEIYGSNPKRFTMYPFKDDAYQETHVSRNGGGLSVIQLTRDRLALRSFGFRFCYHDFGGACLVTEVEPMSPADSAVSFDVI